MGFVDIINKGVNSSIGYVHQKFFGGVPTPYFGLAITAGELFGVIGEGGVGYMSARDPSTHSVVASAIRLLSDTISKSEFQVFSELRDDPIVNHPAARGLNRPVGISKPELIYGIVDGLISNGNAYLIPESSTQLRLVDWRNVQPPRMGMMYYLERLPFSAGVIQHEIDSVIHLRYRRSPDGINGLGPLSGGVLGEIATDSIAQSYTNTMLRNLGVPGLIATPDLFSYNNSPEILDPQAADDIREKLDEQFAGSNRGKAFALRGPWKFFEPKGAMQRVDLRELRWVPEERILACIGIPPAVLNIGTGSEQTRVGATMESINESFLSDTVDPFADKITTQLTQQLMPLYAGPRYYYQIDLSKLTSMANIERRVKKSQVEIASMAYSSGLIGLVEARTYIDYDEAPPSDILTPQSESDKMESEGSENGN